MRDSVNSERFQRRLKERVFWTRLGWVLFISGFVAIIAATIGTSFDISFVLVRILDSGGLVGVVLGTIFGILCGRLGWSKSVWLDLLLNRVSIVFIMVGLLLMAIYADAGKSLEPINLAQVLFIIGIILAVLGIRFQSQV